MTEQTRANVQLHFERAIAPCIRLGLPAAAVVLCMLLACNVPAPKVVAVEDGGRFGVNGGEPADAGTVKGGGGAKDAGTDSGQNLSPSDAGKPVVDDDASATECMNDGDCQDGVYCNGVERCLHRRCEAAAALPCTADHACREALHECDCDEPNKDKDGFKAIACGGTDCDDNNFMIHPGAVEVCDSAGVDEDCDPTTFGNVDADKDGEVSAECSNTDPVTHTPYRGTDCDDHNPTINHNGTETCDYVDNDCDTFIDEEPPTLKTPHKDHGLWNTFYADPDHDLYGSNMIPPVRGCIYKIDDYVLATGDCDDNDPHRHPGAPELCNGVDDDCDGLIDAADTDLDLQYAFTGTDLSCSAGKVQIDRCPNTTLWCDKTTVEHGCDTDGTTLSNCAMCGKTCVFSCGTGGCDEIVQLSLGSNHSCAVTKQGRAACWGRGGSGRLGNDSTDGSQVPKQVLRIDKVKQIAAGYDFSCAVTGSDGSVYCWGNNDSLQLSVYDAGNFSTVPVLVGGVETPYLSGATTVAAGKAHACALLADGHVACWGQPGSGRLGDGTLKGDPEPPVFARHYIQQAGTTVAVDIDNAMAITVGESHSCALISDQSVECWGDNSYGQLGRDSNTAQVGIAQKVPGLTGVTSIAAGSTHTCALVDHQAYCWGSNDLGQLGRSTGQNDYVPTSVSGLSDAVALAIGYAFSCAQTSSGRMTCWGSNGEGQLGLSGPAYTSEPTDAPLSSVVVLAAGEENVCAQTPDKQVFCWGGNEFGQSGNGGASTVAQPIPVPIKALFGSTP
jgi:alpha-tubulin suppressor-like RCC1 family protein